MAATGRKRRMGVTGDSWVRLGGDGVGQTFAADGLVGLQAADPGQGLGEVEVDGEEVGTAGAATASAGGCEVFVDLAGLVDVEAEIARLVKENEKTAGFIAAKKAKLADEKFSARAPEAVE